MGEGCVAVPAALDGDGHGTARRRPKPDRADMQSVMIYTTGAEARPCRNVRRIGPWSGTRSTTLGYS